MLLNLISIGTSLSPQGVLLMWISYSNIQNFLSHRYPTCYCEKMPIDTFFIHDECHMSSYLLGHVHLANYNSKLYFAIEDEDSLAPLSSCSEKTEWDEFMDE